MLRRAAVEKGAARDFVPRWHPTRRRLQVPQTIANHCGRPRVDGRGSPVGDTQGPRGQSPSGRSLDAGHTGGQESSGPGGFGVAAIAGLYKARDHRSRRRSTISESPPDVRSRPRRQSRTPRSIQPDSFNAPRRTTRASPAKCSKPVSGICRATGPWSCSARHSRYSIMSSSGGLPKGAAPEPHRADARALAKK